MPSPGDCYTPSLDSDPSGLSNPAQTTSPISDPTENSPVLNVGRTISSEAPLYQVFRATLSADSQDYPVVAKFVHLDTFPRVPNPSAPCSYTRKQASAAARNEAALLTGALRLLQGTVVPGYYGLWRGQVQGPRSHLILTARRTGRLWPLLP